MHLHSIKFSNYKSFYSPDEPIEVTFAPGINIIAGVNNSGKSALLELISYKFSHSPHKSTLTNSQPENLNVQTTLCVNRQNMHALAAYHPRWVFPYPNRKVLAINRSSVGGNYVNEVALRLEKIANEIINQNIINISFDFWSKSIVADDKKSGTYVDCLEFKFPSLTHKDYIDETTRSVFSAEYDNATCQFTVSEEYINGHGMIDIKDTGYIFAKTILSNSYHFKSTSIPQSACDNGTDVILLPDSSNLAAVISNLQNDHLAFAEYRRLIQRVLPQIYDVTVATVPGNKVEVMVYTEKPRARRADLAVPLSDCGTGVGQIMAMMYVVYQASRPSFISIDEPQAFLHPTALRELMAIFQENSQHQYFIATHSPVIMSAVRDANVLLVRNENGRSSVASIDASHQNQLLYLLDDLGVRLSDVFGQDKVLWVEGDTEEACFEIIARDHLKMPLRGTRILRVGSPDKIIGKDSAFFLSLINRLSTSDSLLPKIVGYLFDSEDRNERDIQDLERRPDNIRFTPRRLYENYLINADAVAELVNDTERDDKVTVTTWEVQQTIDIFSQDSTKQSRYFSSGKKYDADWLKHIHGARLLEDVFAEFCGSTVPYKKTQHSVELTRIILRDHPEALDDISNLLKQMLLPEAA